MDWQQLEDAYFTAAKREILGVMRGNPDHTFYAAALHDSYRELDGQICLPCVAANSIEKLREQQGGDEATYDYGPPNWDWCGVLPETKRLNKLVDALQEEANRGTQNHWFRTEKRFFSTMVRVAKRLYKELKDRRQTTDDFLVYFDDEEGDIELIRKCVPKALYLKHFGEQDDRQQQRRDSLGSLPSAEQIRKYLLDYEEYEAEILKPGGETIDSLIANLKDDEVGWAAANFLGRLADSSDKVIRALRREVRQSSDAAMWSASALGMLGDTKYLLKLTDDEATRYEAVNGLTAPLKAWANESVKPIPLDYRPLEGLLKKECAECTEIAAEELKPGNSFCQIVATDIDEALRGLQSPHLVIRQHAVCILDDRSLGKAAAKKILPALIEMLHDPHPNVRRLAILSISYWKASAKPYLAEIKRMKKDPDAEVRSTARRVSS